jgi:hypothetical protein
MKLMGTPEEKEKLVDAIKLFYDNVMEQKDIRHFFFGMTTDKLVKDIELYQYFVMLKPDRYYRETFSQTAPSAIQIKVPQFEELQITLQTSLRSGGYLKSQIPVLSAKLLELFEESRAQMADENIKVWKAFEVTNQMVCDLYNANRTDARLEKNGDVYGSRGFLYPFLDKGDRRHQANHLYWSRLSHQRGHALRSCGDVLHTSQRQIQTPKISGSQKSSRSCVVCSSSDLICEWRSYPHVDARCQNVCINLRGCYEYG